MRHGYEMERAFVQPPPPTVYGHSNSSLPPPCPGLCPVGGPEQGSDGVAVSEGCPKYRVRDGYEMERLFVRHGYEVVRVFVRHGYEVERVFV